MTLRLVMLWLAILLLSSFWLTIRETSDPVKLTVTPQTPRSGEPVIATFKLNNPLSHALVVRHQFYANGQFLNEKVSTIAPNSSKTYQYAYKNPLQMGEQLNFVVRTESEMGKHEKVLSTPQYPPQVWSSFISFASFSTSVMSSMSSMTYYRSTFMQDMGVNIGIIFSLVLIILLIFLELSQPQIVEKTAATIGRLRIRFSFVTWILFIIFIAMVYTKVAMILAT